MLRHRRGSESERQSRHRMRNKQKKKSPLVCKRSALAGHLFLMIKNDVRKFFRDLPKCVLRS